MKYNLEVDIQTFIDNYYTVGGNLYRKSDDKLLGWLCDGRYLMFNHKDKKYLVHRAIFLLHYGFLPAMIDHIDRNKLNNHPDNLRPTNKSENAFNSSIRIDNSSGYTGVSWNKFAKKWSSYIQINGKKKHVGYFTSKEEAVKSRENYEDRYSGVH